jgi:hypothetical protein
MSARSLAAATALAVLLAPLASAQVSEETLQSISTPDSVDTRIGTLAFTDGAPSAETAAAVYDNLDFTYAFRAFTDTFKGVSVQAVLEGFEAAGIKDNEVLIFSELMDSESLFLTANADTVYYVGFVDLADGPMVVETPPDALGTFDDMWFRWVTDFGRPGPDRGEGGKYLLVGPDYDGYLPEDGFYISHAKTNRVGMLGRSFLTNDDPAPTVKVIKDHLKIYPYAPGGAGLSIARYLEGGVELGRNAEPKTPVFHEGTGLAINTVPPNDYSYYEMLNRLVQAEPATVLDPELMGPIAAIGIRKGQEFAPDDRMKGILEERSRWRTPPAARSASRRAIPTGSGTRGRSGGTRSSRAATISRRLCPRSPRRERSPIRRRATSITTHGPRSSTTRPGSPRRWPCACPGSARSISSPPRTATATGLTGRRPTR